MLTALLLGILIGGAAYATWMAWRVEGHRKQLRAQQADLEQLDLHGARLRRSMHQQNNVAQLQLIVLMEIAKRHGVDVGAVQDSLERLRAEEPPRHDDAAAE